MDSLITLLPVLLSLLGRGDGLNDVVSALVKKIMALAENEQRDPIPRPIDVAKAQGMLKALGFDPGPVDGKWGMQTSAAVLAYQKTKPALVDDGLLGQQTWESLLREGV